MLTSFLTPTLTIRLLLAGYDSSRPNTGAALIHTPSGRWKTFEGDFPWDLPALRDGLRLDPDPAGIRKLPAISYADALDWLCRNRGASYGLSMCSDGRHSFSVPTDNPYKFTRNTSASFERCLETGLGHLLDQYGSLLPQNP